MSADSKVQPASHKCLQRRLPTTKTTYQSPPSQLHPQLLFPSSQIPSPACPLMAQVGPVVGQLLARFVGSKHRHSEHKVKEFLLPMNVLRPPQQSPLSQLQAHLLFSSSQKLSPMKKGLVQVPSQGLFTSEFVGAPAGSLHEHSVQYEVSTEAPQQSPPSQAHPQLLFWHIQAVSN